MNKLKGISDVVENLTVANVPFTFVPVTTTTVVTATKVYKCNEEKGIIYFGSDFATQYVDSASECCNLCGRTDKCVLWTFLVVEKFWFLKNAVPPLDQRYKYTDLISGVVSH